MNLKVSGGLAICGSLLFNIFSSAQSQRAASPDATGLIESIQGPALFRAYCAVCHGKDGKGAGPMAKSLKTAVPDLTRIAVRNGGRFPLARMQKIISGEDPVPTGHGTREMPVWGPIFSQVAWDQDLGRMRVYNLAKQIEAMQAR